MRVAVDLVKDGVAAACVSAGNTVALMAISRFVLKRLPGIDRPAIATILPTLKGHTYVLDLGANVDCSADDLLQFGIMGSVLESKSETFGFDAQTETYVDMVDAGIIDPAKVVRAALQDAASVAGLLITTEAMVAELPKDKPAAPAGGGMPGGGMDY